MKRIALLVLLFSAWTATAVEAQTPRDTTAGVEAALIPGTTVWITDLAGREEKARILGLADGIVTAAAAGGDRRLRASEVMRIQARRSDSLLNGALIGAGVAVASGLLLCRSMEPWENCRDDVGPMLALGAIGAGIGMGVDALIRGQMTIYEAPRGSRRLFATPVVGRRVAGLRVSVAF